MNGTAIAVVLTYIMQLIDAHMHSRVETAKRKSNPLEVLLHVYRVRAYPRIYILHEGSDARNAPTHARNGVLYK